MQYYSQAIGIRQVFVNANMKRHGFICGTGRFIGTPLKQVLPCPIWKSTASSSLVLRPRFSASLHFHVHALGNEAFRSGSTSVGRYSRRWTALLAHGYLKSRTQLHSKFYFPFSLVYSPLLLFTNISHNIIIFLFHISINQLLPWLPQHPQQNSPR